MGGDFTALLAAINLRGRLPGLNYDIAGNYEASIVYLKDDASTPVSVRKSLMSSSPDSPLDFSCGNDNPPGCLVSTAVAKVPLLTNVATFSKHANLPSCRMEMQLPVLAGNLGGLYGAAFVFRPTPDTLALYAQFRSSRIMKRLAESPALAAGEIKIKNM